MSGLATTWTAALWMARRWEQGLEDRPVIGVVNRGASTAHVEVTWFRDSGSKVETESFDLDPRESTRFVQSKGTPPLFGWARIVSDQPVAPWGVTPFYVYSERMWANIEFYAENVVPLEEIFVPLGKVR